MKVISPTTIGDTGAFSRASVATYFDAAGVLQTAAVDEPRLEHALLDGEWMPRGLLLEAASTNMLRYSGQLDNAAWSKVRCTVVANAVQAPDGTMSADKLVESATAGTHVVYQFATKSAVAERWAFQVFAKAGERTKIELLLDTDTIGNLAKCVFDLVAGTAATPVVAGAFSGAAVDMTDVGDGWYRCRLSAVSDTDVRLYAETLLYSTSESYTGNGTSGLYLYGLQLEQGSGSSYIPTAGAAVTRAADAVTGSGLVWCNVPETDYPAWSSVTAYTVGTRVIVLAEHAVYEALTANTNKPPATSPVDWLRVGSTNRWRAFDEKVGTVTSASDVLTFVLRPGIVTGLALINASAALATVSVVDPDDGVVFCQTYDMQDSSRVVDWHAWFFSAPRYKSVLVVDGLPSYVNGIVTVTLTVPAGNTASLGALVVGWLSSYADAVRPGAQIGIQDWSTKEADLYGNWQIVGRDFSKRNNFSFLLDNKEVDAAFDLLAGLRATPAVYIGSSRYAALVIYGFFKDFSIVIPGPVMSECQIEIEGLT